jgi:glycerol uptake facilitator-like aquaporin
MDTDSGRINPRETTTLNVAQNAGVNDTDNGFPQPPPLSVRMICELIGTCLFIFYGAACAVNSGDLLTVSLAHGLVTMWLVYVFGPVSGGHFNAGATIAFAIDGKMKIIEIAGYLGAQALGALLAGALILAVYGTGSSLGTPQINYEISSLMHGFAIEFICTTILSFVIFFTTSHNTHKEAAFPIGLVVFSSFLVGANRDGAALNPWRWFGPAVISKTFKKEAWIYVVGPIGGFAFGYALFRIYKLIWNRNNYERF